MHVSGAIRFDNLATIRLLSVNQFLRTAEIEVIGPEGYPSVYRLLVDDAIQLNLTVPVSRE